VLFREALRPYQDVQPREGGWSDVAARLQKTATQKRKKHLWQGLKIPSPAFWGGFQNEERLQGWSDTAAPAITMMVYRLMALRMVA